MNERDDFIRMYKLSGLVWWVFIFGIYMLGGLLAVFLINNDLLTFIYMMTLPFGLLFTLYLKGELFKKWINKHIP